MQPIPPVCRLCLIDPMAGLQDFFLGYGMWMARLQALAFDAVGRGLLKALFMLLIRRKKPESLEDVMPSKEKMLQMAVRAQKAAWGFLHASFPVAGLSVLIGLFVDATASAAAVSVAIGGGVVLWGACLGYLVPGSNHFFVNRDRGTRR